MISQEQHNQIRALLSAGHSHRQICAICNVSIRTVQKVLDPERRKMYDNKLYRAAHRRRKPVDPIHRQPEMPEVQKQKPVVQVGPGD